MPRMRSAGRWCATLPENRDADFRWDEFVDFHDKELADKLGNFVNRVIVLTHKYFEGVVPTTDIDLETELAPVVELTDQTHGRAGSLQL